LGLSSDFEVFLSSGTVAAVAAAAAAVAAAAAAAPELGAAGTGEAEVEGDPPLAPVPVLTAADVPWLRWWEDEEVPDCVAV